MAKKAEAPRDAKSELAKVTEELTAARAALEVLAVEEDAALASDEAYNSFVRRKKLAELSVLRSQKLADDLETEIDNELARQELEVIERQFWDLLSANEALRARLIKFREEMLPEILSLVHDLAVDEIRCGANNRNPKRPHTITPADAAVRNRPSQQEQVIVGDEIIEKWCDEDGHIFPAQEIIELEEDGRGSIAHYQGIGRSYFHKRRFRNVTRMLFRPASTAVPLWKSLVIPRLDQVDAPQYDGSLAWSPGSAIEQMESPRREHPRDSVSELVPVDHDGELIRSSQVDYLGPMIPSEE